MTQTTFDVDDKTLSAMAELKEKFGVKTNAQVIRKALALARVAAANSAPDNSITIVGPDPAKQTKILLSA